MMDSHGFYVSTERVGSINPSDQHNLNTNISNMQNNIYKHDMSEHTEKSYVPESYSYLRQSLGYDKAQH